MCPDATLSKGKKIAILGWGSLLWDSRPDFDKQCDDWQLDGPMLKLEFSRKSKSRGYALTLVIDPTHGQECQVAYALSKRTNPEDAIYDLRSREGTTSENIGYFFADGPRHRARDESTLGTIRRWAEEKSFDVVIWTDLDGHFNHVPKEEFVKSAVQHIQGLTRESKAHAAEYVWRAPPFVTTPLRRALEAEPWFQTQE